MDEHDCQPRKSKLIHPRHRLDFQVTLSDSKVISLPSVPRVKAQPWIPWILLIAVAKPLYTSYIKHSVTMGKVYIVYNMAPIKVSFISLLERTLAGFFPKVGLCIHHWPADSPFFHSMLSCLLGIGFRWLGKRLTRFIRRRDALIFDLDEKCNGDMS